MGKCKFEEKMREIYADMGRKDTYKTGRYC